MPHAVENGDRQAEDDERVIHSMLSGVGQPNDALDFLNRDLEMGEKADDAIDFEDIGDDELADDDADDLDGDADAEADADGDADGDMDALTANGYHSVEAAANVEPGEDPLLDDLFGDGLTSDNIDGDSHVLGTHPVASIEVGHDRDEGADDHEAPASMVSGGGAAAGGATATTGRATSPSAAAATGSKATAAENGDGPVFRDVDYGDPELREQMELFAAHRERVVQRDDRWRHGRLGSDEPPPAPQTDEELFETIWPTFNKEEIPKFGVLLPGKRAYYLSKQPIKPPKPIQPLKVNLDLEQDQDRSFKLYPAPSGQKRRRDEANEHGIIVVTSTDTSQRTGAGLHRQDDANGYLDSLDNDDDDDDNDDDDNDDDAHEEDNEIIGGISLKDLRLLCEDWDDLSLATDPAGEEPSFMVVDVDDMNGLEGSQAKKPRLDAENFVNAMQMRAHDFDGLDSFDEPELLTAKLAKRPKLDLNDPHLLIDAHPVDPTRTKNKRLGFGIRRDVSGNITKTITGKYNISNDDAYDLLKENHSNRVRSTLGNVTVEHSLPAQKLQYPFYKVKLSAREARSFHRPSMHFLPGQTVRFDKIGRVKTKTLKGLATQAIFREAKDLSMGDNSHMLLVEYSEECPIMLSNFGMGSRLINYYRRRDVDDSSRPKLEIGETQVLLPQDKSPFSIFGNIEPGNTMPTFHNAMYRTPVFKHESKPTDFLVMRNHTGVHGSQWFLRTIENLHVAGQQFPSLEVPGTHSRKVTEAAKRRLRMISYRIYKHNSSTNARPPWLSNEMIRMHLPGTDIAQNRGKMREFMAYDKDHGSWTPKKGEVVPEEGTMRGWIKPEDICLLDSMQVGDRLLQDSGYIREDGDADVDDDEEKDGQSIEQQLAPWQTTKNFINACQGKAMLQLHGEGDPSGRGEAFSFIKTSMKGGFKAIGESVRDKLDAKKELGGHSYNVARQQRAYDEAIKRVWDAQARSLSSNIDLSDAEMDVDAEEEAENSAIGRTPEVGTPAFSRRDDDTASQFSKFSANSQSRKVLKITRTIRDKYGKMETTEEIVKDSKVIKEYLRRRRAKEMASLAISDYKPTGDAAHDARQIKILLAELARLERNKERRHVREKAKGLHSGSAPATPGSPSGGNSAKALGTTRKCANCGQVGHIKTNKKLCPMLNGSMRVDQNGFDDAAFATPITTGPPATPGTTTNMSPGMEFTLDGAD